jgi:hypothetical protein
LHTRPFLTLVISISTGVGYTHLLIDHNLAVCQHRDVTPKPIGYLNAHRCTRAYAHKLSLAPVSKQRQTRICVRCDAYQSCNNKGVVNIDSPPQRPFRDKPRKHGQCGCNQEDPSDDVDERAEIVPRSRFPRNEAMRKSKIRQYRHRIVGWSESLSNVDSTYNQIVVNEIRPAGQNRKKPTAQQSVQMTR